MSMTKVKITKDNKHHVYEVSAKEHSDKVEVCASISTLMCTLRTAINNAHGVVMEEEVISPGNCVIRFRSTSAEAKWMYKTIVFGFLSLAHSRPDDVEVTMINKN
jgi:Protein of unknown function (DUF464).